MHLKRCLARASQAELIVTCFFFFFLFHVITLTFSSSRKQPPSTTGAHLCLCTRPPLTRLVSACVLYFFIAPDSLLQRSISEDEAHPQLLQARVSELADSCNRGDEKGLSLHSLIAALCSLKLAAASEKFLPSITNPLRVNFRRREPSPVNAALDKEHPGWLPGVE